MDRVHDTLFYSLLTYGLNKLEYYIYIKLEMLAVDKHSSLSDLFVSYEENEVLRTLYIVIGSINL